MAQLLEIKKWFGTVEGMEDDGEGWGGLPNVCVCVCMRTCVWASVPALACDMHEKLY